MSYPNSGVSAFQLSNLYSVQPEFIADLFNVLIDTSPYKRRVIWRYRNRGYDSITGEHKPKLAEPCECFSQEWGQGGRVGFNKCKRCNGAGVKGGWVDELLDCFFWNQIPPALQKFGKLFAVPLPVDRQTVVIYAKRVERILNGDYIINRVEDSYRETQEFEYQAMNVRPVFVGETSIWLWIQCQRQAADVTTDKRAKL